MATYLLNLLRTKSVLEDFEVGDELIFMLGIHLDANHRDIAYSSGVQTDIVTNMQSRRLVGGRLTIDRVYNLAVGGSCATLFDFGVIDLEELVEPGNKLGAGFSHREDA